MPKLKWEGDADEIITANDIDNAEESFQTYTGELPPSGVYRFKLKRSTQKVFGTGNPGLNNLLILDGSWKDAHSKFDGFELWDRLVMTKASANFVRGFCQALGVTSADLINGVVVNDEKVVTKIGRKDLTSGEVTIFVNCKRKPYEGEQRLERASYVTVENEAGTPARTTAKKAGGKVTQAVPPPPPPATGKKGKKGKKAEDDAPPF